MACTGTRGKSGRRPPWTEPDARHGKLGKTTYMSPTRTRTHNGRYGDTGKKVADAHRARNWTRAMQNWAKPRTRHTHVHICLHGPLNILYGESGKKVPVTRRGLNRTRAMQNWAKQHRSHVRVHGPTTGGTRTREKSGRCSSWTELDARHGKLGKTTYDAHTRTWTKNGYERSRKKGPIRHGNRFNSS